MASCVVVSLEAMDAASLSFSRRVATRSPPAHPRRPRCGRRVATLCPSTFRLRRRERGLGREASRGPDKFSNRCFGSRCLTRVNVACLGEQSSRDAGE